jgi:pimeloyl-ACP methyl ester carboxylesterase
VLIAPGGLEVSGAQRVLAAPIAGEALVAALGRVFLEKDLQRGFVDPRAQSAFIERVLAQLDTPGFEHAFLSTLRHVPHDLSSIYARLGEREVDVLWGTRDQKVPLALADRLRALIPRARIHRLENAGHGAPVEHAELFTRTLLGLLP